MDKEVTEVWLSEWGGATQQQEITAITIINQVLNLGRAAVLFHHSLPAHHHCIYTPLALCLCLSLPVRLQLT